MQTLCSPWEIVSYEFPKQGLSDIVNGGFSATILDISGIVGYHAHKIVKWRKKRGDKSYRHWAMDNPALISDIVLPFADIFKKHNLSLPIACANFLPPRLGLDADNDDLFAPVCKLTHACIDVAGKAKCKYVIVRPLVTGIGERDAWSANREFGVQTLNVVDDACPSAGYDKIKNAGFDAVDFSLHDYLKNRDIYGSRINHFFEKSVAELEEHFAPHKQAIEEAKLAVWQMHMPYPVYVPKGSRELNAYLRKNVAPKSLHVCKFLGCKYIVVHGFKLAYYSGSEDAEWAATEEFLNGLAPTAKEFGITMCIENLYDNQVDRLTEGPCCDATKAAERIDRLNEKHGAEVLGFCFDTGHANLIHLDFEKFIATIGHRLKVLHIHDNDGWRDLHQIPFAFTKTRENKSATDWEGFIRGLQRINFGGVLNFETGSALTAFPKELQEDVLHFIAHIGRYFADKLSRSKR